MPFGCHFGSPELPFGGTLGPFEVPLAGSWLPKCAAAKLCFASQRTRGSWNKAMTKATTLLIKALHHCVMFKALIKRAQPTMAMEGLGVPTPSFPLP